MSALHGTLDKCAVCPVKDLCLNDKECGQCEYEGGFGFCISCAMNATCNFTPIPTDNSPVSTT